MSVRLLAFITLTSVLLGCQPAPRKADAPATPTRGNADLMLAHGLTRYADTRDPGQALEPVKRAAEQAPNRPDLQWLYAYWCGQVAGCDAVVAETRLRKLDAKNGIAWLGTLARAQQQRNAAMEAQALDALSRSDRIDLYWNTLVWRSATALRDVNPNQPPGLDDVLTKSMNMATERLSAIAISVLRPLVTSCQPANARRPDAVARCQRIAQILQRSDTYIAMGVGLGIEERLAAPNTPAAENVAERIRVARYQQETAGRIMEQQVDRAALSRELIELMQSLRQEQEVFTAVLRWAREPTTPPPDWQAMQGTGG